MCVKNNHLIENNDLMNEFIFYFSTLSDHDFQNYTDFFIHNKIHETISEVCYYYVRLDNHYDYLVTRAFLKALEVRDLYI